MIKADMDQAQGILRDIANKKQSLSYLQEGGGATGMLTRLQNGQWAQLHLPKADHEILMAAARKFLEYDIKILELELEAL